jgi:hypothetical protein
MIFEKRRKKERKARHLMHVAAACEMKAALSNRNERNQ